MKKFLMLALIFTFSVLVSTTYGKGIPLAKEKTSYVLLEQTNLVSTEISLAENFVFQSPEFLYEIQKNSFVIETSKLTTTDYFNFSKRNPDKYRTFSKIYNQHNLRNYKDQIKSQKIIYLDRDYIFRLKS